MSDTFEDLKTSEIHERTQRFLAENDVEGMKTLVVEVVSSNYHEDTQEDLIHAILSQDKLDMAIACFDWQVIEEWCEFNDEFTVLNCPKLFAAWASPKANVVRGVGRALGTLPAEERVGILEGGSALESGKFLYGTLRAKPELWRALAPVWIGDEGSVLRQAARALHWQPSMLVEMVEDFLQDNPIDAWVDTLNYPYSLCIAVSEMNRVESENRRLARQSLGMLVGKPINVVQAQIECAANANPHDVALALILCEKTGFRHVLKRHVETPRLCPKDQEHLRGVVDMHMALGSMKSLVEALCHDELPGYSTTKTIELNLPELDFPEES